MAEATIYTGKVSLSPPGNAVEVEALLLSGEIMAGMFLHVPLNRSFAVTVLIKEVISDNGEVRLLLDCGENEEEADFVIALNFSDETLDVSVES